MGVYTYIYIGYIGQKLLDKEVQPLGMFLIVTRLPSNPIVPLK